jgi:hypothetical protein
MQLLGSSPVTPTDLAEYPSSMTTLILVALIACGSSAREPSPAEEPVADVPAEAEPPEEPMATSTPTLYSVQTELPTTGKKGEPVTLGVSYELPEPCWERKVEVLTPKPTKVVLSITHTRRGDMCAQMITPVTESAEYTENEHDSFVVTVVIDGVEQGTQLVTIED